MIGALAVCGAVLATFPEVVDGVTSMAPGSTVMPRLLEPFDDVSADDPQTRPLGLLERNLFERLSQADREWVPTAEPLPGGGTRYLYRRRVGDPELTIGEIRARMANPPSHRQEREAIAGLLQVMEATGVRLSIGDPLKPGAAGEWDHRARTIRIQPKVLEQGTPEFGKVLNHEAIHVAQSCVGGGLRARPRPLGLDRDVPSDVVGQLDQPLYAEANAVERILEAEAYANQHRLELGAALIEQHCRPRRS